MCSEHLIPPHGGYRELKSYQRQALALCHQWFCLGNTYEVLKKDEIGEESWK